MAALLEPKEPLAPVAPPLSMPVVPVTAAPPPERAPQPDVPTIADLPPQAQAIVAGFAPAATPDQRKIAADLMAKADKETAGYNPNVQPQWGKMLFSALEGKWGDVYKYYNGGATREEQARDSAGNLVGFKEYNERGWTGVIKDVNGKVLKQKEMLDLFNKGVLTKSDDQAIRTSNWVNAQTNSQLLNRGLASQLDITRNDAYNAARAAASANQNIDEQLSLSKKLRPVLDHFGTLSEESRKRLLGYINRYNTNSNSQQSQAESARNANVGGLQSISQTGNVNVGAGQFTAPDGSAVPGAVAPGGGKISGGAGLSATGMGQTQAGVSGREAATAGTSASRQLQEQQNLQAAIMQELQGVIKTPEQFYDFMRFQALNSANDAAYKNIPDRVRPPGYVDIPEIDASVSGSASIVANRVNQLRNNALMAAWSNELFKAQRQAAATGKTLDVDSVAQQFQSSKLFQAINNTYGARLEFERTGKPPQLKGVPRVDRNNRLIED